MKFYRACAVILLTLALTWACDDDDNGTGPGDTSAPARVTNLAVDDVGASSIGLTWTAPGDDGNIGTAESYVLKRSSMPISGSNFAAATTVPGVQAPSVGGTLEAFDVTGLDTTLVHYFAIRAIDDAGNAGPVSNSAAWIPAGAPIHLVKVIPAFKDNSVYQESDSSNALGNYLFSGRISGVGAGSAQFLRRAFLAFAIADSLPAGAEIDSVRLELTLNVRTPLAAGTIAFTLHAMTTDWGEGTSVAQDPEGFGDTPTAGDATWLHAFHNTVLWTTPGGDFDPAASASTGVTNVPGTFSWSSPALAGDVQSWLDAPATNFGWVLRGNEAVVSATRWISRNNAIPANAGEQPRLTVYYTVMP